MFSSHQLKLYDTDANIESGNFGLFIARRSFSVSLSKLTRHFETVWRMSMSHDCSLKYFSVFFFLLQEIVLYTTIYLVLRLQPVVIAHILQEDVRNPNIHHIIVRTSIDVLVLFFFFFGHFFFKQKLFTNLTMLTYRNVFNYMYMV